jgi:hypothetical protein
MRLSRATVMSPGCNRCPSRAMIDCMLQCSVARAAFLGVYRLYYLNNAACCSQITVLLVFLTTSS